MAREQRRLIVFPLLHGALIASANPSAGKKWQAPQTIQKKLAAQSKLVIAPPPDLRIRRRSKDFRLRALKKQVAITRDHPDHHHCQNNPKGPRPLPRLLDKAREPFRT
ncbi:hypothetical protein [Rhizobium sullae]|uniref:hypothetical protein n=1 Tax=Rhizobium sullae TaxID=50338 RepID=UPI0010509775|nr:hypothetical protein [Rhizobium sullae]